MSFTYEGNNGLFTHLGKLVEHYNLLKTDGTDLGVDMDDILDVFQGGDQDVAIDGLVGAVQRWKSEYVGRRGELADFALARLQVPEVLEKIRASSSGQNEIFHKLIRQMNVDGETVEATTQDIPLTAPLEGSGNGGTILITDVLDGTTSPGTVNGVAMPAHPDYNGLTTELTAPDEEFLFRVVADSFHDGLDEGSEEIVWEGHVPDEQHGIATEGSGFIATIQPIHAVTDQYIQNADFEDFTDSTSSHLPDDWDVVEGELGTNVTFSTSTSHGDLALKLIGGSDDSSSSSSTSCNGSIEIKQDIAPTSLVATKRYCVTAKIKTEMLPAEGTLTIGFEDGNGNLVGDTDERIAVSVSALTGAYVLHYFFINMPQTIPDDLRLVIRWDGCPDDDGEIHIDDLGMAPVNYGGGIGAVAVRGSEAFVREDRFTLEISDSDEGAFQGFFRRAFGRQLPSCADASYSGSDSTSCGPSIDEDLAT